MLDDSGIFRLSKILGHPSVIITQKTYADLIPDAWEQDYHCVSFTAREQGTVHGTAASWLRCPSGPGVDGGQMRPNDQLSARCGGGLRPYFSIL